jgi:hypothetical protein
MIISDMRHSSLLQGAALSGQKRDSPSGSSRPETVRASGVPEPAPKALENPLGRLITRINTLQESLDKLLISYPPFFPIGAYHRMDWIMEIRAVQTEAAQLAAENKNLPPIMVPAEELSETSKDEEIMGALQEVFQFRTVADAVMKKQAETPPLSIKI